MSIWSPKKEPLAKFCPDVVETFLLDPWFWCSAFCYPVPPPRGAPPGVLRTLQWHYVQYFETTGYKNDGEGPRWLDLPSHLLCGTPTPKNAIRAPKTPTCSHLLLSILQVTSWAPQYDLNETNNSLFRSVTAANRGVGRSNDDVRTPIFNCFEIRKPVRDHP